MKQIGATIGRSDAAVCNALNGVKKKSYYVPVTAGGPRQKQKRMDPLRYELRAAARDESRRTGEPVEAIYARLGVATIDRSRAYDEKRASA